VVTFAEMVYPPSTRARRQASMTAAPTCARTRTESFMDTQYATSRSTVDADSSMIAVLGAGSSSTPEMPATAERSTSIAARASSS
jgi:hypothetical protein